MLTKPPRISCARVEMETIQAYYEGSDYDPESDPLKEGENQVFIKKCLHCGVFTGSVKVIVENGEIAEVVTKSEGSCLLSN